MEILFRDGLLRLAGKSDQTAFDLRVSVGEEQLTCI
jgi:hypothetical protein